MCDCETDGFSGKIRCAEERRRNRALVVKRFRWFQEVLKEFPRQQKKISSVEAVFVSEIFEKVVEVIDDKKSKVFSCSVQSN